MLDFIFDKKNLKEVNSKLIEYIKENDSADGKIIVELFETLIENSDDIHVSILHTANLVTNNVGCLRKLKMELESIILIRLC